MTIRLSRRLYAFCLLLATMPAPVISAEKKEEDLVGKEKIVEGRWGEIIRPWFDSGDWGSAQRWLAEYLKWSADPDVAYAYLYTLYKQGRCGQVLKEFRGKRCAPVANEVRGVILLGLTHWRLGDSRNALRCWAAVLAIEPHNGLAWECIRVAMLSAPRLERRTLGEGLIRLLGSQKAGPVFVQGLLATARREYGEAEKLLVEAHWLDRENEAVVRTLDYLDRHMAKRDSLWLRAKPTIINDLSLTTAASRTYQIPYRLPWPAGLAVYCGSHAGRLETPHSDRGQHGLDFFLPPSTPVLAARDGTVVAVRDRQAAERQREFGTFAMITHGDGTFARYYHLEGGTVRVRPGQFVRQGQVLGIVGRTGKCQSLHLHFEVVRSARRRFSGPAIYSRRETIPVDFEDLGQVGPDKVPGSWIVSANAALR